MPVASPLVSGFILVGGLATFDFLTRPNRVDLLAAHVFAHIKASPARVTPARRLLGYMYEQAFYMVNSFRFTNLTFAVEGDPDGKVPWNQ